MCRICWFVTAILALAMTALSYKFVIQGKVEALADGRTAILLEKQERDFVLAEMRLFLESVQQITGGIDADDMARVAEYARKSGNRAQTGMPGSLVGKFSSVRSSLKSKAWFDASEASSSNRMAAWVGNRASGSEAASRGVLPSNAGLGVSGH